MSVARAHDICDRIEHALKQEMGEAVITIQVEPEHKAKPRGVRVTLTSAIGRRRSSGRNNDVLE